MLSIQQLVNMYFQKNGVTKILDDVTLDLHIPEGFDLNKIKKLTDYAESKGFAPLISTIESKL